jgi:hypothetical protein
VKFNPKNPGTYDFTGPPATYGRNFHFSVERWDRIFDAGIDLDAIIGMVEIQCRGGQGGNDWRNIEMSKFTPYRPETPLNLESMNFASAGYSAVAIQGMVVDVAVDGNRDGEITFDGNDKTTVEKPCGFWINDDRDRGNTVDETDFEEDDLFYDPAVFGQQTDAQLPGLECRRDLEDLTRLWIDYSWVDSVFPSSDATVVLKARMEADAGQPAITLYQPVEEDGGREYLKDEATGYNQLQGDYGVELCRVTGSSSIAIPRRAWATLPSDKVVHLLFEGASEGDGRLIFEIWKDGAKACDLPEVHLRLRKAKDMYETWSVGDVDPIGVQWNVWPSSSATQTSGQDLPAPEKDEEKDYVMFVHGWNMPPWEKEAFANTMFKRMWHQGYKGRFGAFRWPTFHGLSEDLNTAHFDGSEERAWNSASPLNALTASLAGTFKDTSGKSLVRLYAQSMGNVVAAEAMRQMATDPHVHTYISAQAALSSHVWDNSTPEMDFFVPTTPNVYGYYWQAGATSEPHHWAGEGRPSYMSPGYMPSAPVFINHYNPLDWALSYARWQLNQSLKPDAFYYYSRPPFDLLNVKQRFWTDSGGSAGVPTAEFSFPNDRFQVFSYAAESRGYATGQQGATGGKFKVEKSLNLNEAPYNFGDKHKGHSAQFRSTVQKRWTYWEKALEDMNTQTPQR